MLLRAHRDPETGSFATHAPRGWVSIVLDLSPEEAAPRKPGRASPPDPARKRKGRSPEPSLFIPSHPSVFQIHHDKHHAAYVNNLNAALAKFPELSSLGLVDLNKAAGTAAGAL